MSKRTFVALMGVALAVVLATGGLIASNMGMKLNYELAATGGSSATGTNTIALPFNQQSGLNNSGDLGNDIGGFAGGGGPVQEISYFVEASDSFNTYTGGKGQVADNVQVGEGFFVRMGTTTNYIVVGSHDPAASIPLDAAGAGSATGTNLFSVPYHTTAANTGDLGNDIGGFAGGGGPVQEISTFIEATDSFNTYTGGKGQVADNVELGAAVFVRMGVTVNYIPSHY
jgi:hypothetical protein